jgi:hypothetical protein
MNGRRIPGWISFVLFCVFSSAALFGQTSCEEGNGLLNSAPPAGITPEEIIQKFAAKEALFKQARDNYIYTQDVTVQTLEGTTVDGEFREVTDITYDDKGARLEHVTFAPQSSLVRLGMTKEDLDDVRHRVAFVFTTDELPQYNILYAGTQHVDEIDTYVFDAAPKRIEKGRRYFQGRIWVDNRDLQIVKTCGKSVPDVSAANSKKKHVDENLSPRFVTYREQIDGQYWFPTYTRADEDLHFKDGDIHIRETIKYTNYKRFGVKSRIIFKGEVPPTPQPKPQPPK